MCPEERAGTWACPRSGWYMGCCSGVAYYRAAAQLKHGLQRHDYYRPAAHRCLQIQGGGTPAARRRPRTPAPAAAPPGRRAGRRPPRGWRRRSRPRRSCAQQQQQRAQLSPARQRCSRCSPVRAGQTVLVARANFQAWRPRHARPAGAVGAVVRAAGREPAAGAIQPDPPGPCAHTGRPHPSEAPSIWRM